VAQERLRISHSSCCAFFKSQDFLAGIIKNFVVKLTGCLVVEHFSEFSLPLKPIKIEKGVVKDEGKLEITVSRFPTDLKFKEIIGNFTF